MAFQLALLGVKGEPPSPRRFCSAALWAADHIIVFGGAGHEPYTNDIWSLDLTTNEWKSHSVKGHLPEPRICHSAVVWSNYMLVFGGSIEGGYIGDAWSLTLQKPSGKPAKPAFSPR